MERTARVSFTIEPFEGTVAVIPLVDGTLLSEMVAAFDPEQHFEPAGGTAA
jgi:hypothetical protein